MAEIKNMGEKGHQVTGKVAILYGTVKAISPDGTVRLLKVNSPVFADDRIITGDDGSVSIVFDTFPPTQLDLGRVSDVVIDEDVYGPVSPDVVAEASAEQKSIQEALLAGDQPIELDPTAAGVEQSAGGGHSVFVVSPDWIHVTPESGAETRGISWGLPSTEKYAAAQEDNSPPTITVYTGNDDGHGGSGDGSGDGAPGNVIGGNDVVYESGLSTGSNAAANTEFAQGTFTVSDPDGLSDIQSVTINNTTIPVADLAGTVITGVSGKLTITSYNPSTGVGSYTYELTTPTTDGPGPETDIFTLKTTDSSGSSDETTITIEITDDVPTAVADSNSIAEDTATAITGDVLANDISGADTPTSFVSWSSTAATYGTFTDTGNGTYSYVLDNTNLLVQGLGAGQQLTETFDYTMRDADGDTDTATLTITINGTNDTPHITTDPGNVEGTPDTVYESGLSTGSNAAANTEFANGTFTVSDADGLDDIESVTINGTPIAIGSLAGAVIHGANGTLTVTAYDAATGVAAYQYKLTSPTTDGPGLETDVFTLTVSDGTSTSAPATITIEIVDDIPNAVADTNSIAEDTITAITGNVLTNDLHTNGQPGADTPTSFVSWSSTAATYGTFTDTGNGTYSYVLNNANPLVQGLEEGETLTETFVYTMRDADGDTATATLTITITGTNDTPQITHDPGIGGSNAQVYESGLATGSAAGVAAITANGTFTVSDADGLDDIAGVSFNGGAPIALGSLVGQTITGTYGDFLITGYSAGVASYTYTLTSAPPVSGTTASDSFNLVVTDTEGSSAPATITIEIVDDIPNAVADTNSIAEDTITAITGNVLTNDLHTNGQPGADTPTSFVSWSSTAATYGTFTDTGNGTYSYVLNNANPLVQGLEEGETLTETFVYTMRDADGDTATATLTITITGTNDTPQITHDPGIGGSNAQVYESGLATGSAAGVAAITANGTFTVSDADGLDDIAGVSFNGGAPIALGSLVGQTITGTYGDFLITGYSAGVASYTYTLTSAPPVSGTTASDSFNLVVTDTEGSSAPATITIEIVDDIPNAVADTNSIAEDTITAITGNVLTNDLHTNGQPGADTPTSFVSWSSTAATYGTFTDTGNGTYSYVLNNANPLVQGLEEGETLTETFVYTMRDADGDTATATLTITITGTNDTPQITHDPGIGGSNAQVYESGLATGSAAGVAAITANGTFTVSDADGLDDIAGVSFNGGAPIALGSLVGQTITGTYGDFLITGYSAGVASYTYTLTSAPPVSGTTASDSFNLVVTDTEGSSASATITINIADDIPNAVADTNSIAEDTITAITGNVLTNDLHTNGQPGADTPTSFVSWSSTAATYGTFTDTGNGTYSYVLNNANPLVQGLEEGETLTETFVYTMRDADGDTATATLTITITGTNDTPQITHDPGIGGSNAQVYESGLATGSAAGVAAITANGTFTVSDADGLDDIAGVSFNGGAPIALGSLVGQTITGTYGDFLITGYSAGVASYTYTLTSAPPVSGTTASDSFNLVVTDTEGSSASATITINIADDIPNAVADTNSIAEDTITAITGNVLTNDLHTNGQPGADTPTSFVSWSSTAATYGTFTDTGNGTYSYVLNNANPLVQGLEEGETLTETFVYTMRDADGDTATATLTITITGTNDTPQITHDPGIGGSNAQVYESGLATGSAAGVAAITANGTFTVSDADGLDDIAGVSFNGGAPIALGSLVGQTITGTYGDFLITGYSAGVASYTYTLTSAPPVSGTTASDSFNLVVTDTEGSSASATITINIADDIPNAVADTNSIAEDTITAITGNVLTNDLHTNGQPGADTPTSFVSWSSTAATYGTFTDTGNGTYSYVLNNANPLVQGLEEGETLTETFVYTMRDADGDTATATLTITITGTNDTPQITHDPGIGGSNAQVYESGLATGSAAGVAAITANGTFTVSDADGLDDIAGVSFNGGAPIALGSLVGQTITGTYGDFLITGYSAGVASYTYTLTSAPPVSGTTASDSFNLVVTDTEGSSASATITINIADDIPNAVADTNSIAEDTITAITGNVLTNDLHTNGQPGADTPTSFVSWSSTAATYGTFTDTGNGTYSYVLNNANPLVQGLEEGETLTETFVYTMRDADGDTATATLTITITGTNDTPQITHDPGIGGSNAQVYESGLATGSAAGVAAITANGTFTVSDADGLDDIAGVSFNGGAPIALGSLVGQTITGTYGDFLITGYSAGVASYTYTLTSAPPVSGTTASDSFNLVVTDTEGSSASATITINIADDIPNAVADENFVVEGGVITGNVLTDGTDDIFGADGAVTTTPAGGVVGVKAGSDTTTPVTTGVGTAIHGAYGVLTLNADGSYTYDGNPDAITSPQSDVFVYTIEDGDGDFSTTTLTIHLTDSGLVAPADNDALVYEKALDTIQDGSDLAASTYTGSIPGDTGETDAVNQLNASGGVGPYTYSLVGSATGDYGTIQINPDGSYIYTLTKPYNTTPDADNGMNTEYNRENFAYRVTDANGNTATGTITVNIVDDVPSAADQSITVTDNLISGSLPATFGADGPAVLQVVSIAHDADGDGIDEIYNTSSAGYNTSTTTLTLATQAGGALAVNFSTGDYTYTGPASATLLAKDVFTYEIMDADGDTASATLTVNLPTDGMLVVGTNEDDTDTQTVDHYIDDAAPYAGVITGSGGNDVLVGDVGGADNIVQPGHNYNISLIVDSSGSMDNPSGTAGYNRMELAQAALKNLADQLVGHDGTINLQIIDFDTNVVANTSWSHITSANLSAIYTAIDNMVAKGGTNYEAAFDASRTWLSSQNNGYENITFFLTDGNPTYYLDSRGKVAGPGNTTNYDTMSNSVEAFALLSPISHVEAIGIGSDINENYLKFFDNTNVTGTGSVSFGWYQTVTGPVGQVEIVNTAEELSAALQHGSSEYTLFGVGDDHIVGGDGDDIIFGGSVHTDALADAHSLATADGAGWKVFEKLGWTEEQIVNYINEHHEALAAESGRTGDNDIIYGGAGNDIIYGQEGNDIIYGGEGNDILNGGSGNDILSGGTGSNALTGGSGADTFTLSAQANDTVKDYSQTDGDKVDISAILDVADEAVAKTYLGFHNNGDGKAVLEVYNSSTDHSAGNLVSCITFDNITDATSLDSLLGKVDIDHDA